jgi:superfamily I DNA/RNA helicase
VKLPTLDQLFPEQWTVYDYPVDASLFVVGPPGSGKTSLVVLRTIFLVNLGLSVVVVTRNRMLAALAQHLGAGTTFLSTTMHSFISKDHSNRFGGMFAPEPVRYQYDWPAIIARYDAGGVQPRYDHIIIDEGQNLPGHFFEWARRFGGHRLTVFADEDQATCDQTSSLEHIKSYGALSDPARLTTNHRNTPEIAAVAEHFHRSALLPPAIVVSAAGGEIPRLLNVASWADLADRIATRYNNRKEAIGVIVQAKQDVRAVQALMRARLTASDRIDAYTSENVSGSEASIMVLDPGITMLTSESVIGLEFTAVFLVDLARSLPCTDATDYRRMYMLCARARTALFLVDGLPSLDERQLASLPDPSLLDR